MNGGSESLGVKNSGHYGAGKSHTLEKTLRLYPENAYHQINSGSQKSLYALGDTLKHKALILTEGFSLEARGESSVTIFLSEHTLIFLKQDGQMAGIFTGRTMLGYGGRMEGGLRGEPWLLNYALARKDLAVHTFDKVHVEVL